MSESLLARWPDFLELTKPRVVALMLITAVIGMCMAVLLWKFYHYYLPTMYIDEQKKINKLFVWLEKDSRRFTLDDEIGEVVRSKLSVGDINNEV